MVELGKEYVISMYRCVRSAKCVVGGVKISIVDYLDQNFKPQHGKYSGWTAQIIQHELDHVAGIVI